MLGKGLKPARLVGKTALGVGAALFGANMSDNERMNPTEREYGDIGELNDNFKEK